MGKMIGKTISHYKIIEKLGEGGMGVVYRAQDTKLEREVAIKVLPEEFAKDLDRLARFEREAKLLASLNHSNIATIYGLEESEGEHFLALELVEGKTLAEQLSSGPLKSQEALEICRQIAEALETAHERGIIHRDLKPSNVKITPEGKVKVLDFGLAKAFDFAETGKASSVDPFKSPTLTVGTSRSGVILGTAAYMSPEQARGKPLDKRTDIWSFGCLLYELLTGRQTFKGETTSDTIAMILEHEPNWKALPGDTLPTVRKLLRRCLEKDPKRRFHDIADARIEIEDMLSKPSGALREIFDGTGEPRSGLKRRTVPWSVALLFGVVCIIVASVIVWNLKPKAVKTIQPVKRFVVNLGPNERLGASVYGNDLAISSDGSYFVYVAGEGKRTQLYLRQMNQLKATPLPGTEGAEHPFFSPDGRWVGFFAHGKLKKVLLEGGTPLTICKGGAQPWGATWGPNGYIIFGVVNSGLLRVSDSGGEPMAITTPDTKKDEIGHRWPEMLPGGKAVLFTIYPVEGLESARIAVFSLETGEQRILLDEVGYDARYASTGHIVYAREGILMAVPFDLQQLKVTGSPFPVLDGVARRGNDTAFFSFSRDGSLVYISGLSETVGQILVWVDRQGQTTTLMEAERGFEHPRISPDGKQVAALGSELDIWVYDMESGRPNRLTFEGDINYAVWSPDGTRIAFASDRSGHWNLYWKPADGSGEGEQLLKREQKDWPASWSSDGQMLTFYEITPTTQRDIWVLSIQDRTASPFYVTSFNERVPMFSPDSRWIAYVSDESGQDEVYVQPYPGKGGKWQISEGGGREPMWAPDGRELFYRKGNMMMCVAIETKPAFKRGMPKSLFEGQFMAHPNFTYYDIHPDGDRFLMVKTEEELAIDQINVVLNWFEELKQQAPTENKR